MSDGMAATETVTAEEVKGHGKIATSRRSSASSSNVGTDLLAKTNLDEIGEARLYLAAMTYLFSGLDR